MASRLVWLTLCLGMLCNGLLRCVWLFICAVLFCCLAVLTLVNRFCFCSAADMERVPESDITHGIGKLCFALSLVHIILS